MDADQKAKRAAEIKESHGKRAQHVDPYKPNRKQRRAQEAMARQAMKERK